MSRRGSHTSSSSTRGGRPGISSGVAGRARQEGTNGSISSSNGSNQVITGNTSASSLQRQTGPRMQMPADPSRRIVDFSSPEDRCPQCKTDRYLNPKLRLLVSPCYHKMCESCLDRIFSLGPAPCPECGHVCRKYEFGVQTFQDLRVEKEVDIRRRVGKLFNKREDDFDTLKEYNDYLEEVEAILFNLINDIDVPNTEARIAAYQSSNKASIQANTRNLAAEGEAQRAREEAERIVRAERAARRRQREERDRSEREQDEQDLVEALAGRGKVDVETVLHRKRENEENRIIRMEREEAQEEEEARRREIMLGQSAIAAVAAKKGKGVNANAKPDDGWPIPFTSDMLFDFEGPLATLDDGRALFDLRGVPTSLGGISIPATSSGYEDPWITNVPDKDEVTRLRSAGYDWSLVWERDIRSINAGLDIPPLR